MTDLPPHLMAYRDEVQARLHASPQPFAIIADQASEKLLRQHLSAEALRRATFVAVESAGPEYLPPPEHKILVTHAVRAEAHRAHRKLLAAKRAGVVVALALHDRRLQTYAPGWEATGIMYPGMFRLAATYCEHLPRGSYAEFGVFDGNTFAVAWHALNSVCDRFIAYDSFAGIQGALDSETRLYKDGDYSSNIETFIDNMRLAGVDLRQVVAVAGAFQETLRAAPSQHHLSQVAVAHIDVDVYEPAKLALDYLSPVLQQGALLLFDDFDQLSADNDKGERRAVREWLADNPGFGLEPYRNYAVYGRSFIFHRKA